VVVPHFNNPDTTTVLPGITLSYAFNSKFSINGGYKYGFEVDGEDVEAHMASVGAVYALTEQVEVNGTAYFVEEQGFSGVTAGVAYHF
jgi:long-subunit fatty acid transport protein